MDRFETAQRRRRILEKAVAHKGGRCEICGYDKCLAALDFHHFDPMGKDFNISSRLTSFKAVERELAKTILLCANCHREVHDGLHPGYIENPDAARGQYD